MAVMHWMVDGTPRGGHDGFAGSPTVLTNGANPFERNPTEAPGLRPSAALTRPVGAAMAATS
jgi:hypothetical protein